MLQRAKDSLVPDSRAGNWAVECFERILDLAKQCIAEYEDRIGSFIVVVQRLRQIKADFSPITDSIFKKQIDTIISKNENLSPAQDAKAAQSIRKCLVCFDKFPLTDGFECTNKHFVCNVCFAQIVKGQSEFDNRARFRDNGCKILCTVPGCREVVEDRTVAIHADKEGWEAYFQANLAAREEKVVVEVEERMRAQIEQEVLDGLNRETELLRYRNHIIEELLTIKCPRCRLAFIMDDTFNECFALRCSKCGSHFCGWCLRDCGEDAHKHVNGCRGGLKPRGVYPQNDDYNGRKYSAKQCFKQVHGPRRAAAVKAYMGEKGITDTERETVIKMVEEQWNTGGATLLGDNIALR